MAASLRPVSETPRTLGEVWTRARQEVAVAIDPIARLLDPRFTDTLWPYEHSKIGTFIPGNLHRKQVEALHHPAMHRWLLWGNQSGKTSFGAIDLVLSALGRHPLQAAGLEPMPPFHSWASALSWELWENMLLPELLTWIPKSRILDAPPARQKSLKRDLIILADNGAESRITGKSAEQGAQQYQSARVNKIWLDEEHPEAIWDEMQPRLLRFGGRTIATMTPLLGLTWVFHRVYEPVKTGAIPHERHWYSHAGIADNPSITEAALEELRSELQHNPSQLAAREHGYFVRPIGAVYDFDLTRDGVELEGDALMAFLARAKCYGQVDFGKWRFAFAFGGVDRDGTLVMIEEVFSQAESADQRAKRIHDCLKAHKVTDILIYGDCADPEGLAELNASLERIDSPYYVIPVQAAFKNRKTGILRVENLLSRQALKVRRGMGRDGLWYHGKSASSAGRPVRGSRFLWELVNWQYPKTADGKVQKEDPDDATADGADMMDGLRYLVMQWLGPVEEPRRPRAPTLAERLQKELEDLDRMEEDSQRTSRYGSVLRQG